MRHVEWIGFKQFQCYFAVDYCNNEPYLRAAPMLENGERDTDEWAEIEVESMTPEVAKAINETFHIKFGSKIKLLKRSARSEGLVS